MSGKIENHGVNDGMWRVHVPSQLTASFIGFLRARQRIFSIDVGAMTDTIDCFNMSAKLSKEEVDKFISDFEAQL